ncbi:MAG: AsmA-like C-terminal region-containing protein [Prevotellaceae bacterium]|jgi:hypothetical protein|nr:AsmA-like C-terminal region-containing protein [Prevotellaceae bacterium]
MRKVIRIAVIFFSSVVAAAVLVVGGAVLYVYTHQEEIKQMLVKEINKNLLAPVTVQKIDISVFKNFPLISLQLKGVTGQSLPPRTQTQMQTQMQAQASEQEPHYQQQQTQEQAYEYEQQPQEQNQTDEQLFSIENLALSFSIIDIYYKKYVIKKITIEGGEFNLIQYDKIQNNYIIWKTPETSQETETQELLSFKLKDIKANNTSIRYRQLYRNLDVQILCKNIKAGGELYAGGQKFDIKGNYKARLFETDSIVWIKEREGELNIHFSHDVNKGAVYFDNSNLSINNVALKASGNVFYDEKIHTLDLLLEGKKNKLENILSLLPAAYIKYLDDYKSKGIVDFSFRLDGDYSQNLQTNIKFSYQNGAVTHTETNTKAEDIFIDGEFTNGSGRCLETSELVCKTLSAKIIDNSGGSSRSSNSNNDNNGSKESTIEGTLSIKNFADPYIDFNGNIQSELAALAKFSGLSKEWNIGGEIIAQLLYKGGISKEKFKSAVIEGMFKGKNIFVNGMEHNFYADSIISNFDKNISANIYNFSYNGDRASFVKISLENFLPFLFKKDELNANINARNISWNKVYAISASTELSYFNSQLRLNNFNANVFDGNVKFDMQYMQSAQINSAQVNITANVENINVSKCFASFDNFEQQVLTDKNISGTLTSDFGIRFIYNYDSGVDAKSVLFDGTINIKNGNLKNMECLRSIARFTGENDLQNIHFSEISNTLNIKDRIITVPLMRIESDAAEFDFKGSHTFDNYVDYRINLELSDMLSKNFKKRKNKDEEFGNIVEEQKERIRLPLHIYGFMDDLKVKYDFKQNRENFKEKIKEEREKTKEILNQEFSRSPQHQQNQQQKKQWKEQEKGQFIFEKEDDTLKTQTKTKPNKPAKKNQFSIEEDD